MEINEKKIIAECQKGRLEGFAILYDFYVKKIYNFIYFRTHHKETAEDITSQVFMRALKAIESFKGDNGSFSSWLYAIARNSVIDYYRTQKSNLDINDVWGLEDKSDIVKDIDTKVALEKIQKYLLKLAPEQREVIIMRLWDQLSYKEISDITGKSEASLKMAFSRTIGKLREDIALLTALFFILNTYLYG